MPGMCVRHMRQVDKEVLLGRNMAQGRAQRYVHNLAPIAGAEA